MTEYRSFNTVLPARKRRSSRAAGARLLLWSYTGASSIAAITVLNGLSLLVGILGAWVFGAVFVLVGAAAASWRRPASA